MPAQSEHPEHHAHHHHRKINATQTVETIGVVIFILIGIAMLIGLLTAQGHIRGL